MNKQPSVDLQKLYLFNIRAKYLDESRFLAWVRSRGRKQPDMERLLAGEWLVYEGLNREDLDSFFLNLRLLIQDRDGFSIRCLGKIYENFTSEFEEAKKAFKLARAQITEFLNQKALVQLDRDHPTTHGDLLDIFLYGGIAHNDEKLYPLFVRATQSGFFAFFSFLILWNVVIALNSNIQKIASINKDVIRLKNSN